MERPNSLTVAAWVKNFFIAVGVVPLFIMAFALRELVVKNHELQRDNRELRHSQECRFDVATEVNEVGDGIGIVVARIVSAAVAEKDEELLFLNDHLTQLIEAYEKAAEERASAVEDCNEKVEEKN